MAKEYVQPQRNPVKLDRIQQLAKASLVFEYVHVE